MRERGYGENREREGIWRKIQVEYIGIIIYRKNNY